MAAFGSLSEKLKHVFSKLSGRGKLTELEIKNAMREVRVALLEADVNFLVVKEFIANVSQKAVGEKILNSLTPAQQVIKIINEELTALMGSTHQKLVFSSEKPSVFMLCGLQGAGKTTMCAKLAAYLKKQGKKTLLVACDIYRPAAIQQLVTVGKGVGAEVFEKGTQNPVKTSRQAIEYAKSYDYDVVILDTAGRLHINEELMDELLLIKKEVKPCEILLTVDAMTGQDAVTVAEQFDKKLDISGVIVTKLDGDTRGGAALSIKAVCGKPIKFCGTGEKSGDIEPFHPDRMASRILGMGDVLTLIEKAQANVSESEMKEMEKKLMQASFTLEDFLVQMDSLKKMGGLKEVMAMMPGGFKFSEQDLDEKRMAKMKAIIQSMTPLERRKPEIIKSSRRKRIAAGSATTIQEVNTLLRQFEQSKEMMKRFKGKGAFGRKLF